MPASMIAIISRLVATGRRIKGRDGLMIDLQACPLPRLREGLGRGQLHGTDSRPWRPPQPSAGRELASLWLARPTRSVPGRSRRSVALTIRPRPRAGTCVAPAAGAPFSTLAALRAG